MRIVVPKGKEGKVRWLLTKLGVAAGVLLVAAVALEVVLRLFGPSAATAAGVEERGSLYRYDPDLGWSLRPNTSTTLRASRPFSASHNSAGFRDIEWQNRAPGGIVFLGDSFVWGFDVEASERFTDIMRSRHPERPVYNLGVNGYGTDQEFLLALRELDRFRPKIVFLLFSAETDRRDNRSNRPNAGYYKPYFTITNHQLKLNGIPVPHSERAFLADHEVLSQSRVVRLSVKALFPLSGPSAVEAPDPTESIVLALNHLVRSKGAILSVGLTGRDESLERILKDHDIPFVDLSSAARYQGFGNHWTPEGHRAAADKIEQFILTGGVIGPPK